MASKKYSVELSYKGKSFDRGMEKSRASVVAFQEALDRLSGKKFKLDIEGLEHLKGLGRIDVKGNVSIRGLKVSGDRMSLLRDLAAEPVEIRGSIDIEGLRVAADKVAQIRKDAGSLGRVIARGMTTQFENAENKLADIQRRITGVVRVEKETSLDIDVGEFGEQLSEADEKAVKTAMTLNELQSRIKGLQNDLGRLGAVKVTPLAGGAMSPMSLLGRGFTERGGKSIATREANRMERELSKLTAEVDGQVVNVREELDKRLAEAFEIARQVMEGVAESEVEALQAAVDRLGGGITVSAEGLSEEMRQATEMLQDINANEPSRANATAEEIAEWEEQRDRIKQVRSQIEKEMAASYGLKSGDEATQRLLRIMENHRRAIEGEGTVSHQFLKEWKMGYEETAEALRREGQKDAADALENYVKTSEELDRLKKDFMDKFAQMQTGGQVALPEGAKGTLVDFVNAEKALGKEVTTASDALTNQGKALRKLVSALDEAKLSAEGYGEAQRETMLRMEGLAFREIRKKTPLRGTSVEDAAGVAEEVFAKLKTQKDRVSESYKDLFKVPTLASEVKSMTDVIETSLTKVVTKVEEMAAQLNVAFEKAFMGAEEEAGESTKGIIGMFEKLYNELVGHSIVPDMVDRINAEFTAMSPTFANQMDQITQSAGGASQQVIHSFDELTESTDDATDATRDLTSTDSDVDGWGKQFTAQLANVAHAVDTVEFGIRTIKGTITKFFEKGEEVALRSRQERMFIKIAGGAEKAEAAIRAFQDASFGTLTRAQAMEQGLGLMTSDLDMPIDEIADLSKVVGALGAQFAGYSPEKSLMNFKLAVNNMSIQRLNELGVEVGAFTERWEELKEGGMEAQEAFRTALVEQMTDRFEELGLSVDDAANKFPRMRKEMQELGNAMWEWIEEPAMDAADAVADLAKLARGGFADDFSLLVDKSLEAADGQAEFEASVQRAVDEMTKAENTAFDLVSSQEEVRKSILKNAETEEEYRAGLRILNKALEEHQEKQDMVNQAMNRNVDSGEKITTMRGVWDAVFRRNKETQEEVNAVVEEAIDLEVEWALEMQRRGDVAQEALKTERELAQERATAMLEGAQAIVDVEKKMQDEIDEMIADNNRKLADRDRDRTRDAMIEAIRRRYAVADEEKRLAERRAEIENTYAESARKAREVRDKARLQARENYGKQLASIEENYRKRIRDIEQQYEKTVAEAQITRDAMAIWRARKTKEEQLAEAQEQREEQRSQAAETYEEQLEAANEAYQEQMVQAQAAREEARIQLEESIREELEKKRLAELEKNEIQRLQEQWRLEDMRNYLASRRAEIQASYAQELAEAQQHYQALEEAAIGHRQRMSSRYGGEAASSGPESKGGTAQAFQAGGYSGLGGLSILHAGEFVLNPQTTRAMEGLVGGSLTQANVTRAGGRSISISMPVSFSNVSQADQGWIMQSMANLERQVAEIPGKLLQVMS